ncbi:MAG: GrpB family protein [Caulobacterales bacterium]
MRGDRFSREKRHPPRETNMSTSARDALGHVAIVDYDPAWPARFQQERARLLALPGVAFDEFEHVGSTAVPGLAAKPTIDMMASVEHLDDVTAFLGRLEAAGYQLIDVGFTNRLFLRKAADAQPVSFHLHIVLRSAWAFANERILRDHLIANPDVAAAYGALKASLAAQFADDSPAYTAAKTAFIQQAVDTARTKLGLPRVDVWEN